MNILHRTYHYFLHLLLAKDEHSLHSPFLFDFYNKVILDKNPFYVFHEIEGVRHLLEKSNKIVRVIDFGAGQSNLATKKVSDIARRSAKSPKLAQMLFKMVNYFRAKNIIELGTSLGISTLYLATVNKKSRVITFEGSPEIAEMARINFKQLNVSNIEIVEGNMDETLAPTLKKLSSVDFAFVDGNHRYAPTLNYFEQILLKSNPNTVIVLDDIYWSNEMTKAWNQIKNHPKVSASIDLYYFGVVFLNPKITRQHYKLRI